MKGYFSVLCGGSLWGVGRVRRWVCDENFWKYIDSFFKIVVGERWRFGNVGMIGLFY